MYFRAVLPDDFDEYSLVSDHPNHVSVVVHRNDGLEKLAEEPKCLFLGELHRNNEICYEIEALAIPYVGVLFCKCDKYIPEGCYRLLAFLRDRSRDVQFDGPEV